MIREFFALFCRYFYASGENIFAFSHYKSIQEQKKEREVMTRCGECTFCRKDRESGEWICCNEESENYGLETDYNDRCEEGDYRDEY